MIPMPLILASSSPYRKALLERLQLPFQCLAPNIDETPLPNEAPTHLVERLAKAKAHAILQTLPADEANRTWVIGSDQVAVLQHRLLTKPHTTTKAIQQLQACSGKTVTFYTGLCLAHPNRVQHQRVTTTVQFRTLTLQQIERYIALEQPLDCAGSFKCEGLGISLFDAIHSSDPTALIGLPLIALRQLLTHEGLDPLTPNKGLQ